MVHEIPVEKASKASGLLSKGREVETAVLKYTSCYLESGDGISHFPGRF